MASSYPNISTAIYSKTNVSAVVGAGKLTAIFEGKGKATQACPYGVFNLQAAEPVVYAFGVNQVAETIYIQFRVYSESQSTANSLLKTWLDTLGTSLSVTGFTIGWLGRDRDLPPNDQQLSDRYIFGRGVLVKVIAE